MARRNLECALKASQYIQKGGHYPEKFRKIQILKEYKFDNTYESVYSLQYSFDGEKLAVGFASGAIRIYNGKTGEFIREVRKPRYGGMQIMCLRFHPRDGCNHILLASTADGKIYAINTDEDQDMNQEIILEKDGDTVNEINCIDFSDRGFELATAGKDLSVRIYDARDFQLVRKWEGYHSASDPTQITCSGMRLWSLKWHPIHEDIFVTGGWENHLKIWNKDHKEPVRRVISGPHICGDGLDIKGNPVTNQSQILTGSWVAKDALQIWNYTSGKVEQHIDFNYAGNSGAYLYCAQFCDNDTVIAGGSGTNSVQAIDVKTNQVLDEIKFGKAVQALDTVFGGRLFAVGSQDNKLILAGLQ